MKSDNSKHITGGYMESNSKGCWLLFSKATISIKPRILNQECQ